MQQNVREQLLAYFQLDKQVVSASGGKMQFDDGTSALDFLSQYGANPLGANDGQQNADIAEFLASGEPTLSQPMVGQYVSEARARLRALYDNHARLSDGPVAGDVFFTQSGAESVELAIKIARSATLKPCTIALENGFHGKTTGAVQLTANEDYAATFRVENSFVRRLSTDPSRNLEADFAALTEDGQVNGVILEFVQGEGGMQVLDPNWVQRLVALARERDILVIADEVQTGLGRTGTMLCCEQYDVQPDLVLLAKALGGGIVPIGAVIAAEDIVPPEFSVFHSSTFANNNFTCFVASRFLDRVPSLLDQVRDTAAYLGERLHAMVTRYPDVFAGTSGRGLMRGVCLQRITDIDSYVSNFAWSSGVTGYAAASWLLREQGIVTMPCFSAPACLRLQPPLIADRAYIDRGIDAFEALAELLRDERAIVELLGARPVVTGARQSYRTVTRTRHAQSRTAQRRFQFTVHPLDARNCYHTMPAATYDLEPNTRRDARKRMADLISIAAPFAGEGYEIEPFELGGKVVEGRLFILNYTASQIMNMTPRNKRLALEVVAASAHDFGTDVLGLGAFTSILAGGGHMLQGKVPGSVTAGSSLTAYAAVHAALDNPGAAASYGVVGAGGSVGAVCWQMLLAEAASNAQVRDLTLFYNPDNPTALTNLVSVIGRAAEEWRALKNRDDEYARSRRPLIDIAQRFTTGAARCDNPRRIAERFTSAVTEVLGREFLRLTATDDTASMAALDRVLVSTNATRGIDALKKTKEGALLYDIGFPPSIDPMFVADGKRRWLQSGLVKTPGQWEFGRSNIASLPKGISLGCFAETMTLAATEPNAAPQGEGIRLAEAERIGGLARSVGLDPVALDRTDEVQAEAKRRLKAFFNTPAHDTASKNSAVKNSSSTNSSSTNSSSTNSSSTNSRAQRAEAVAL